jgi:flagellin
MSDISIPMSTMMLIYNMKQNSADHATAQNQLSTGHIVHGPKDNSAVWQQSEKMKFEHAGYDVINRQLGAVEASLSVGLGAAENIIEVLEEFKDKLSQKSSNEEKLNTAREDAKRQIDTFTKMAFVNGQNWTTSSGNETVTIGFETTKAAGAQNNVTDQLTTTIAKKNLKTSGSGILSDLPTLSFADPAAVKASQKALETMIEEVRNAASHFGESEARLAKYKDLNARISASLQKGIGSLIDADLTAASSRIEALKVQQHLSFQALEIANKEPQNLLALFR